jgi:hypothetical protein
VVEIEPIATGLRTSLEVRFVPNASHRPKKKPPEGGFQSLLMTVDQAAINAAIDFRR